MSIMVKKQSVIPKWKGWEWPVYVIGWTGVLSLFFWIYQVAAHQYYGIGDSFFGEGFHKRVYHWGWVVIIFWVLTVPLIFVY